MSNIILIGNGPSVKKREFGDLIDSYDTVVRFNWYHIKGYEKNVGTKTDHWWTTVYDPVRLKEKYDLIVEHSWEWGALADKTYSKLKESENPAVLLKTFPHILWEMNNFMREAGGLPKDARRSSKYETYSTGAIAAWCYLYNHPTNQQGYYKKEDMGTYDKIDMFGFDWWDMDSDNYHHYGDKQTMGRIHDPKLELLFFKRLHEEGKIYDINPDSDFHYFYE